MTESRTWKVVVCGSRNWSHRPIIDARLDRLLDELPRGDRLVIFEGGAKGADRMAREWAKSKAFLFRHDDDDRVSVTTFFADWKRYGTNAGPIRNQRMLNAEPDRVLAFHEAIAESRGTRDILNQASSRNIRWERFDESSLRPVEEYRP